MDRSGSGRSGIEREGTSFRWSRSAVPALILLALTGCGTSLAGPHMRTGAGAYQQFPGTNGKSTALDYRLGPLDRVDITVFQEADISLKGAVVDASGDVSMPLIGRVKAVGLKSTELADLIAAKLQERFYVNPQVTVAIASSVAQKITVEGEVTDPGIYQLTGPTTLVDTIALAKGETENAKLGEVAIIRYIDGKRMGAIFDLERIRRGDDPDPEILPKDVVIVGHSANKQTWHDLLKAAPLLNAFAQF
jgi:polysaccharide export outer membrane protein